MQINRKWLSFGVAVTLPILGACGDIFEVESPGRIADKDLNDRDAVPGLVVGMSYDLAGAMNATVDLTALAAGELTHGGSYNWAEIPRGTILPEDVDGTWASMVQAEWVTEHGIERIKAALPAAEFDKSSDAARAYMLAGFANRLIGENVCETVINGGAAQPYTVEFDRGIANFDKAIAIGTASGDDDIVNGAYAGRASLKAWKGDWTGAVADASKVPANYLLVSHLMSEGLTSTLFYETQTRYEYTVFGTEFAAHPLDKRAVWDTAYVGSGASKKVATGANGATPHYRQKKYNDLSADIPLAKGTEMLVLRAEAALRNNDINGAYTLMNQARAQAGMTALPVAGTIAAAWADLHFERGAITWLENRRFWDLRRWFAETGPAHHDFLQGRDKCIPISKEERNANPNIPDVP
jgi:starch-binding outer membrane protein, SusD/RagB family